MKKFEIKNALIVFIIFEILLITIIWNSGINKNELKTIIEDKVINHKDISAVKGYKYERGKFIVDSDDPGITVNNITMDIGCLELEFKEPVIDDIPIQLFYAEEGLGFSEENSIRQIAHKGEKKFLFDIPYRQYCSAIRLDIDGDFSLKKIVLSKEEPVVTKVGKTQNSLWVYIILTSLNAVFIGWNFYSRNGQYKSDSRFTKKEIRIIVAVVGALMAMLLVPIIQDNYVLNGKLILAISLIVVLGIIGFYANRIQQRMSIIGCCLVIIIGFVFIMTIPIGTIVAPDDEVHFNRAVYLSHIGDGEISYADKLYQERFLKCSFSIDENKEAIRYLDYANRDSLNTYKNELQPPELSSTAAYCVYVPSAIGLFLGRALHLDYYYILLWGKIGNLLFYALCVYWAIKISPVYKLTFAIFSLLPTNLFLACSYSYDGWVVGISLVAYSYILKALFEDKEISYRRMALITFLLMMAFVPKPVYFPMVIIPLILSHLGKDKLERLKLSCIPIIGSIILAGSFVLPFLINSNQYEDARAGGVDSMGQILYILHNPMTFIKMMVKHLYTYMNIDVQVETVGKYGYLGYTTGGVLLILVLIISFIIDDNEKVKEYEIFGRLINGAASIFSIVIISLALYMGFTNVGNNKICGFQRRYLLPVYIPLLLCFGGYGGIKCRNKTVIYNVLLSLCLFTIYIDMWNLWITLYY